MDRRIKWAGAALSIDGFRVPAAIQRYMQAAAGNPTTLEKVAQAHEFALSFFTPAVFLMFVAMGLLSSPMLHRTIHARWLGLAGQLVVGVRALLVEPRVRRV